MHFDQQENLRSAILRKKARIAEIDQILSGPRSRGADRRFIRNRHEEKQHLLLAVGEHEAELERLTSRPRHFTWDLLDHELANRKLSLLANELQRKYADQKRRVGYENRKAGNSEAYWPKFSDMCMTLTEEWLHRTYKVYCDVWATQGNQKSPSFILTVFHKGLIPVIAGRLSSFRGEVEVIRLRKRTSENSAASEDEFVRRMQVLEGEWKGRLEIEAKECEYAMRAGSSAVAVPVPVTQRSIDAEVDSTLGVKRTLGRRPRLAPAFVELAGTSWLEARCDNGQGKVTIEQLGMIASKLDGSGFVPPAEYLEKHCATELRKFNSRNSNAKNGPIMTWVRLVSSADKATCGECGDYCTAVRKNPFDVSGPCPETIADKKHRLSYSPNRRSTPCAHRSSNYLRTSTLIV